jgi:membrane protein DedA with SNARE-associated domain
MSNQWLGSIAWDPQRQQALRMDGIIIIVIIIIVVVVIIIVVEKR